MFGQTNFELILLMLVSLIALATDLARGRIYNWLTLPLMVLAFIWAYSNGGVSGLLSAFAGWSLAVAVLFPLFLIKWIGGGDVKLLMGYGALLGVRPFAELLLLTLLVASVFALLILITKGRLRSFLQELSWKAMALFILKDQKIDLTLTQQTRMPMALPIGIAVIWTVLSRPLLGGLGL